MVVATGRGEATLSRWFEVSRVDGGGLVVPSDVEWRGLHRDRGACQGGRLSHGMERIE